MPRTAKSDAKKATTKKSASTVKKAAAEKKSMGYIFFNCDEEKNQDTMNLFYENNRVVYRDIKASRKALWEKVQAEIAAERIYVDKQNEDAVKNAILEGDPTEAGQYIQFGTIISINCI